MKFTPLPPDQVRTGRGLAAYRVREPYRAAVREMEAGRVTLERGEKMPTVRRLLADASKEVGVRIRASVEQDGRSLVWKRVGSARRNSRAAA